MAHVPPTRPMNCRRLMRTPKPSQRILPAGTRLLEGPKVTFALDVSITGDVSVGSESEVRRRERQVRSTPRSRPRGQVRSVPTGDNRLLFDHLVCAREGRGRDLNSKCFRSRGIKEGQESQRGQWPSVPL